MKKLLLFLTMFGLLLNANAQSGKSKSSSSKSSSQVSTKQSSNKQYRSADTGRYVTKSQADKSPKTTYSTSRKKK